MRSRAARLTAAALATALALAGCGSLDEGDDAPDAGSTSAGTIKVGYVSPQSGALAPFGEADSYVVQLMTDYFTKNPIKVGDRTYTVSILLKDSQSDSKRAAEVTTDLINTDGVDVVLATSTPDTTNPVADQCEANGVPCITSVAPWQPWYFGRGAQEGTKFQWTYHFFWGLEDVIGVYQDMWGQVSTNKSAAALWPNDPDGTAWGSKETGFAPAINPNGYTIVDPGFYPNGTQDFTAQISQFKSAKAEVLLGVPIPPDFTTFWKQAKQQGYTPKIATIGKALLFPSSVEALGADGQNLGTEVWWSPNHPFTSSLTQQSAKDLAEAYSESSGKQWTQPLGFAHAVFEVMAAAYAKAGSTDKKAVADALGTLNVSTVVGPVDFTKGPVPNVAKTPLVGGQWRAGADGKYDLVIVSNSLASNIPSAGKVEALS